VPKLAPPELDKVRAWHKPTHHTWFSHASLLFDRLTRAQTSNELFQILKSNIIGLLYWG